ncbi:MAG: ATP-dependent DNA helicase chl1 [Claussenomyces sp. TS43310]|nr:MAG: ATP-dependent DNA helicase chl1 [Claussenomyces sp. TS43310]
MDKIGEETGEGSDIRGDDGSVALLKGKNAVGAGKDGPKNFHHPYTPYEIQETFMKTVYEILERGESSVGILESPTGTGKSLSLICASLTWLRDHKRAKFDAGLDWGSKVEDEPEWIIAQAKARKRRELLRHREDMEARLAKVRAKEKLERERYLKGEPGVKRRKMGKTEGPSDEDDDGQFVLDDYESDREAGTAPKARNGTSFSTETLALMGKLDTLGPPKVEDEDVKEETKIFYCSRTHSQLTQFINELRRVKIPAALPLLDLPGDSGTEVALEDEEFKHLTLGSRKNLCINPSVSKLSSVTAINERCQELQQSSTPKDKKCVFLPNKENQPLVNEFRDHTLASIRDIEELGALGKQIGICPYYASRDTIKPSEMVTLPYPLLLQKSAREALGISLKGHVIVIDEAHNLMDAISGIYGVTVSLGQLKEARAELGVYLQKFRNRLKGKNRVYVAQVLRLLDSLITYLNEKIADKASVQAEGIVEPTELLAGKGVDQINLYKLLRYLQASKLARKVESYSLHTQQQSKEHPARLEQRLIKERSPQSSRTGPTPTLQHIASLVTALTNPSKEGQICYALDSGSSDVILKYTLLDPTHHFREIVTEARAVILAGGTMSPMGDYTDHLLSYLPSSSITTLSCGHVIPKSNLLAWTLSSGPGGNAFEFTYSKRAGREGEEMIDELGRAILNLCTAVPDGVVVFFQSYAYLETVVKRWQVTLFGSNVPIWKRLGVKKALFRESKDTKGAGGEDVLSEYSEAIASGKGGLLLSVVGGKMSEGINFSDRLGRCVVIVGLPFPSIMSGEWKAKLGYIERVTEERLETQGVSVGERKEMSKRAGREFYENACMRAVNQSVGRAIRHRADYAAIVMVDRRFGTARIKGKLPGWIQEGLVNGAEEKGFVELMSRLGPFYRSKRGS